MSQSHAPLAENTDSLALFAKIPDLPLVIDPADRVIAVSDFWLRSFGFTRAEVIGRPSSAFLPSCFPSLLQLIQPGAARVTAELLTDIECQFVKKEECLYRIAYEALNNALKHAAASEVKLYLALNQATVTLEVVDNGSGFHFQPQQKSGGLGLISMRERAAKLDGTLDVISTPGQGTKVLAALPVG